MLEIRDAARTAYPDVFTKDAIEALHVLAKALALCGERGRALVAIQTLVKAGYSKCLLRVEEEFASLRAEPKFRSLVSPTTD